MNDLLLAALLGGTSGIGAALLTGLVSPLVGERSRRKTAQQAWLQEKRWQSCVEALQGATDLFRVATSLRQGDVTVTFADFSAADDRLRTAVAGAAFTSPKHASDCYNAYNAMFRTVSALRTDGEQAEAERRFRDLRHALEGVMHQHKPKSSEITEGFSAPLSGPSSAALHH